MSCLFTKWFADLFIIASLQHTSFLICSYPGLLLLRFNALQLPFFFFVSFSTGFWTHCLKLFRKRFRISIKKACDQDLIHSLDKLKGLSVKNVPQVVTRDACGTWHGLCSITSIHSIQGSTRNSQKLRNQVSQWMAEDPRIKTKRNRVDK